MKSSTHLCLEAFKNNDEWIFWAPHSYWPSPFSLSKDKDLLNKIYMYLKDRKPNIDAINMIKLNDKDGDSVRLDSRSKFYLNKGTFVKENISLGYNHFRHCFAKASYIRRFYLKSLQPKYMTTEVAEALAIKKKSIVSYTLSNNKIFYEKPARTDRGTLHGNVYLALGMNGCKSYDDIYHFTEKYKL